jgi:hypothetical protein
MPPHPHVKCGVILRDAPRPRFVQSPIELPKKQFMCPLSGTIARILQGISAGFSGPSGEILTERRPVDSRCPSGERRRIPQAIAFAGVRTRRDRSLDRDGSRA